MALEIKRFEYEYVRVLEEIKNVLKEKGDNVLEEKLKIIAEWSKSNFDEKVYSYFKYIQFVMSMMIAYFQGVCS